MPAGVFSKPKTFLVASNKEKKNLKFCFNICVHLQEIKQHVEPRQKEIFQVYI